MRYVRARVKIALKNIVNPIIAPKPIQYHFASGNTPRDLRVCTPRVSLEAVLFNILFQLCPNISFTEMAFCAYIIGEIQYPQIHHFFIFSARRDTKKYWFMKKPHCKELQREKYEFLPLTRINPPNTMTTSNMNDAKTLATIMFLATPPIKRKSAAAI